MENKPYNFSFKFNLIILLLLIVIALSALNYLKPNIFPLGDCNNNAEISQNFSDIKYELGEIKAKHNNETDKFKEISSTLSKIEDNKEEIVKNEHIIADKTSLQISYHKLSNLLLYLFQIKEIIYNGGDYTNYLYEFNQFSEDNKIKKLLDSLSKYSNGNFAILNLLGDINRIDLSEEEKIDSNAVNTVQSYLFNIVRIKNIGKESLYKNKIDSLKNYLIKRELKPALEIVNQLDDSVKNQFTNVKAKIEALEEIEFILNDCYKYIGSNEFLKIYSQINS